MKPKIPNSLRCGLLTVVSLLLLSAAAPAAETITLKVGFGPGGSYDALGRFVSRYLGNYLPGKPDIVVQNVGGAGSLKLAKMMAFTEPGDGSVLGLINPSVVIASITDPAMTGFDSNSLNWIGSLRDTPLACVVRGESPVQSVEDLLDQDIVLGTTGKASGSYQLSSMLKKILGAKFTIITGFKSSAELNLAIERGEIEGWCGITLASFYLNHSDASQRLIAQWAFNTPENLSDIPNLVERVTDPDNLAAAKLLTGHLMFQNPLFLPPGTPAAVVAEYRQAFARMVANPEILGNAKALNLELQPKSGEQVAETIRQLSASDPAVIARAAELSK